MLAYCKHGEPHQALQLYRKMQDNEGHLSLTGHTLVALLKGCATLRDFRLACRLHAEITRKDLLNKDDHIGSSLIYTYAKCGFLDRAQGVFDNLLFTDAFSWTSLISGYVEHGFASQALDFFEEMQQQCCMPDSFTYVSILKACGIIGNTKYGRQLAWKVFGMLPARDLLFWNALLAGYAEHGLAEEAFEHFNTMKQEGISCNDVSFICLLKICGTIEDVDRGYEVHTEAVIVGLDGGISIGSTLVDMYMRCGFLEEAQAVFDELPDQGVVTWNALMVGYAEVCGQKVLNCFRKMQMVNVSPDAVTFICCLKACMNIQDTSAALGIHLELVQEGLDRDLAVGSTLINMYGKFGFLAKSREVFDRLPVRDAVAWNALITAYVENGYHEEAFNCFDQLHRLHIYAHPQMLGCILKACGSVHNVPRGERIHTEIAILGWEEDTVLGSSLIDFYAKCGLLVTAEAVFDKLSNLDIVVWNTLIVAYTQLQQTEKALQYFDQMQINGICPDEYTYACIVKACSTSGTTMQNKKIHAEITRKGLEKELYVGSTLVNAYARGGSPLEAKKVFTVLPTQDVVSWSALIAGYALQLGEIHNTLQLFEKMIEVDIKPNIVIMLIVINALSHSGQVDQGQMYLECISSLYHVTPTHDHYSCMLDLFGRAGHMEEAFAMVENMPFHPRGVVWDTMLGACRKWRNADLGKHAFDHAVMINEKNVAAYICMSNIYASATI
ncbi:hypothetical protein KP509_38G003700 [Ceratopteris richardii]|nr:hypothetical protein KP509_38G003700 [Ceratopteris richardii]KAH7277715.1 hypothetical protein KP509_38G003700 [Ceratopteris richardii]KAH7277716.1 hypothetical protein KP509_38G003700 [Ceratopteris richardii]KAH7277717.1 hypothetical protein KP509_38G003700 [Ceratopteris richardii]KAH7277722.1 hypothetical protein KP509_38G003700 [Ceratopteris richardii]